MLCSSGVSEQGKELGSDSADSGREFWRKSSPQFLSDAFKRLARISITHNGEASAIRKTLFSQPHQTSSRCYPSSPGLDAACYPRYKSQQERALGWGLPLTSRIQAFAYELPDLHYTRLDLLRIRLQDLHNLSAAIVTHGLAGSFGVVLWTPSAV